MAVHSVRSAPTPSTAHRHASRGRIDKGLSESGINDDRVGAVLEQYDSQLSSADSKCGQLQRLIYRLYVEKHVDTNQIPTSGRFLIYEGEHGGFFSKETKARTDGKKGRRPDQDFTEALIFLSEVGLIPWDHIVDETRQMHIWRCAPSVADYLGDSIPYARIDPWVGVARPIIITEARTVGGVFARTIGPEYLVPIVPTNGQTKRFLITQVAPLLDERDAHVLYGGDSDYCGDDIENNTRRVLEQYCKRSFTWGRVAITEEQREELRAAGIEPILKKDKRYKDGREHWAYEAEALGQEYLTQIFRDKLDELLPKPLKAVLVRQTKERKELAAKLKSWCQK